MSAVGQVFKVKNHQRMWKLSNQLLNEGNLKHYAKFSAIIQPWDQSKDQSLLLYMYIVDNRYLNLYHNIPSINEYRKGAFKNMGKGEKSVTSIVTLSHYVLYPSQSNNLACKAQSLAYRT